MRYRTKAREDDSAQHGLVSEDDAHCRADSLESAYTAVSCPALLLFGLLWQAAYGLRAQQ